ncbi:UNVERIFIED_CONTAM: hypothetical protein PYX00_009005 [Menopon gallinae]|uniref:Uncharacterized protein n=1 Tax=Menopon gallinae TaxID=328185 RepID=A0AAW2HA14_9NEOP
MVWAKVLLCVGLASAASADFIRQYGVGGQGQFVPIISQDFQLAPDARAYSFSYSAGDGSQRQEQGVQRNTGTPAEAYSVTGSYSYTLPNGVPVQVNYVADEFGYQPSGPGVHPDIARAVAEQVAEARANPQIHSAYPGLGYKRYR